MQTGLDADKQQLRVALRQIRGALSPDRLEAAAIAITARVLALPELASPATASCYVSIRREVPTRGLIDALRLAGHRVAVPRVDSPGILSLREFALPLVPDLLGIASSDGLPVDDDAIDVALCPGLGFDARGGRLGYGGGYYDRWLAGPGARAVPVGVALDEAIVDAVPAGPDDRPMAIVVTPTRTLRRPT
jgi:5-formyltetrahydrofolate cyclo-ligase